MSLAHHPGDFRDEYLRRVEPSGTTCACSISRQQPSANAYRMYREEIATYGSRSREQYRYRPFPRVQVCHLILVKDSSSFAGRRRNRSRCLGRFGVIATSLKQPVYCSCTESVMLHRAALKGLRQKRYSRPIANKSAELKATVTWSLRSEPGTTIFQRTLIGPFPARLLTIGVLRGTQFPSHLSHLPRYRCHPDMVEKYRSTDASADYLSPPL